jgi:hypothetical protein
LVFNWIADVTHPIRRLRRFAQIKNKTCVSVVKSATTPVAARWAWQINKPLSAPTATTPPAATIRVRIYSNKCANLSHSQCGNEWSRTITQFGSLAFRKTVQILLLCVTSVNITYTRCLDWLCRWV